MTDQTRRTFLKQAAVGAAVLAYPASKVLGANNRVRVAMIGVGDRGNDRGVPNAPPEIGYRSAIAVHMANLSYKNKKRITLEEAKGITPEYS